MILILKILNDAAFKKNCNNKDKKYSDTSYE